MTSIRKFIFIVGVGRSGTSLLQSMFASNKHVCYLPETGFIRRFLVSGLLQKCYFLDGRDTVVDVLNSDLKFKRFGFSAEKLFVNSNDNGSFNIPDFYDRIINLFSDDTFEFIGDKDPRLIEYLLFMSSFFPSSHVINIIRDPRDVLLSKMKAKWSRSSHVWKHIFANRVQLKLGVSAGTKNFGLRYHQIIYEELIEDPERVLSNLCFDIGLPFDFAMLQFDDAAKKLVSQEEISWKKETFGPLLVGNVDKWKEGLSPREAFLTELCCRQAFKIGGYKFASPIKFLSLADWLWVAVGASVIILLDWPYRLYRGYTIKRAC